MFASLFSRGQRADLGDRSPFGSFWFEPTGMRTPSGARVTASSAMRLTAVYASVRVVSESFAVLPFRMYRPRAKGGRDLVTKHWLLDLMRRPNVWQTPFEWREMMQGHLCLRGNAFNEIVPDGTGGISSLLPIHPDRIQIESMDSGDFRYAVQMSDGSTRRLPRESIWHIRGLSSDGMVGLNPIELAAETIGMALSGQSFAARFFANDAKPGGWIEYDGNFKDREAKIKFRESWQQLQGGKNRGKTAVLEKGMKYHELTINAADAQFLETMKQSRSEIAGIFRVPPHKIGDLERATFSNIEQQSMDFISDCIQPWSSRWESSIQTHLLLEQDQDLILEFDFLSLARGDMAARTAYYTGNIQNGSLTRNEARIAEGRNPLDGLDEPLVPVNMKKESDPPAPPPAAPGSAPEPGKDPIAPGQQPTNPPAPDQAPSPKPRKKAEADGDRLEALATAAADRLARREARDLAPLIQQGASPETLHLAVSKQAAVVKAALGISPEAAAAYANARLSDPIRSGSEEEDILAAALPKLQSLALKGSL